jgi:hypothetical protein
MVCVHFLLFLVLISNSHISAITLLGYGICNILKEADILFTALPTGRLLPRLSWNTTLLTAARLWQSGSLCRESLMPSVLLPPHPDLQCLLWFGQLLHGHFLSTRLFVITLTCHTASCLLMVTVERCILLLQNWWKCCNRNFVDEWRPLPRFQVQ